MASADLQFFPESPYGGDDWGWPPRSRLYSLAPIGIGTPMAEGLLSYVIRLAAAHSVGPRRLIRDELMQACPELAKYRRAGPFFKSTTRSANGLYRFGEYFVEAVEKLCRQEVGKLTLLPLKGLLPFNGPGLFAPTPRWCPACYGEMLASRTDIYQPLAWSLDLYRVCPGHRIALADHCPVCGTVQEVIPRTPLIGFCSKCGTWLGQAHGEQSQLDPMEFWFAQAIGEIVAELPVLQDWATRQRFVHQVGRAIDVFASGSRRQFCLRLGLPELALQYLFSSDKRPTLSLWLEIAYGLNVGPVRFIKEDFDAAASSLPSRTTVRKLRCRAKKNALSPKRRQAIEQNFKTIAEAGEGRLPVCELARRWDVTRSCLRYLWPELCRRVSADYKAYLHTEAEKALAEKCRIVRALVDELVDHGAYPSQRSICNALAGRQVSLANPAIREAYRLQVKHHLQEPQ